MSEKAMWRTLGKNMIQKKAWLEATRHEDKLQSGIPDVSFVSNDKRHGWMELKQVDEWPVRESTILRLPHFTTAQKTMLRKKGEAGGRTWLLLKVGRDWLLFSWYHAPLVGQLSKEQLFTIASKVWIGKMDYNRLGSILCDG